MSDPKDALFSEAETATRDRSQASGELPHRAHGFDFDRAYLRYLQSNDSQGAGWQRLAEAHPGALRFRYRRSPERLLPLTPNRRASKSDPPFLVPSMVTTVLDSEGRLVELVAHRGELAPPTSERVDWGVLFEAASLPAERFHEVEPKWTPPVFSETRLAWEGSVAYAILIGSELEQSSGVVLLDVIHSLVVIGAAVVLMMRLGLFAAVTSFAFDLALRGAPLTLDVSSWYAGPTWVLTVSLVAVTVYAAVISRGGRPFFGARLIPE